MKKRIVVPVMLGLGCALAIAASDPVLMKINGKDVKLSEFEYLYNKNSKQQVEKESLDDYVKRFELYKMKVAAAEDAKIDTLPSFKKELNGYKTDMVKNYLVDTTVIEKLAQEEYSHFKTNRDVSHIILQHGRDFVSDLRQKQLADSLHNVIATGGDFEALAKKFSADRNAAINGGHIGFISAGLYPYQFEKAVYTTPVGKLADVLQTNYGYQIIKVNGERPDLGLVTVEHILKLFPQNATEEQKAKVKAKVDSIYAALEGGANFEDMAKAESEDSGSAQGGGKLPEFGVGRMVPQFESVAFGLKDGEMSKPIETMYGYHIIKRLSHRGTLSYDEARQNIIRQITMDERNNAPSDVRLEQIEKECKTKLNDAKFAQYLKDELTKNGGYDSTFVARVIKTSVFPIATYEDKGVVTASQLASSLNPTLKMGIDDGVAYVQSPVKQVVRDVVKEHYINKIINKNTDLSNLMHEYRDGMMLFEISNRMVWDKAAKDTVGLTKYFDEHRTKYNWDKPRFKGIILLAKNDTVLNDVKADIAKLGKDTLTTALHKKYGSKIRMERMLMPKGENTFVDYLIFNGEKATPKDKRYATGLMLEGKTLDQPETMTDVIGQVTADYQDVLDKQWTTALRQKYPVTLYKQVLQKVK